MPRDTARRAAPLPQAERAEKNQFAEEHWSAVAAS
jgi:hypothetical protein